MKCVKRAPRHLGSENRTVECHWNYFFSSNSPSNIIKKDSCNEFLISKKYIITHRVKCTGGP